MPDERDDDDLPGDVPTSPPPAKKSAPTPEPVPEPPVQTKNEPEEPAPETTAKKHTHTSKLVAAAAALGFTQADLDNHDSDTIWAEIARIREQDARQQAVHARPPQPESEEELDLGEWEDPDTLQKRRYTEKDLHPPLAKALKDQAKQIKALTQKLTAREQADQHAAEARFDSYIDRAFAALGPNYEAIYGKGGMAMLADAGQKQRRIVAVQFAKLTPKDSEESVVAKIAGSAATIHPVSAAPVSPLPPVPEANGKPVNRLPNGRYTKEEWDDGALLTPTARNGAKEVATDFTAKKELAAVMKSRGIDPGPIGDGNDDEDLPG